MVRRLLAVLALALPLLGGEGAARAQAFADPRSMGFHLGPAGNTASVAFGVAGIVAAVWLARIRIHHARRFARPYLYTALLTVPLLLVGAPLLVGAIAGSFTSGDALADTLLLASSRLIALAAANGWLIYELMAGVRQHEHDLYAEQRPQDSVAKALRTMALALALVLVAALALGTSVTVVPRRL